MESSGSLKINGSNVKVEASSMLSMESSGAAMLSGSPLKMG
jgi:hypothetical protein